VVRCLEVGAETSERGGRQRKKPAADWDLRGDDEWETDTWPNECNACGTSLTFDQLVAEAS
jgi:hypothetical protein